MKKLLFCLTLTLCISGISYASFKVEKSTNTKNSSAVVLDNEQGENTSFNVKPDVKEENDEVNSTEREQGGDDGTTAIILALVSVLFLPFGLHNWYLGRKKQALWQTLLVIPGFILVIPAIVSWVWQVVDLVRLLINGGSL